LWNGCLCAYLGAQLCIVCVCVCFFLGYRGDILQEANLPFFSFGFLAYKPGQWEEFNWEEDQECPPPPTPKPQFNNLLCKCSKELSFGPFTFGGGYMRSALGSVSFHYLVVICLSEIVVMKDFDESKIIKESNISSQSAIILKICKLLFNWGGGVCLVVENFLKIFKKKSFEKNDKCQYIMGRSLTDYFQSFVCWLMLD